MVTVTKSVFELCIAWLTLLSKTLLLGPQKNLHVRVFLLLDRSQKLLLSSIQ